MQLKRILRNHGWLCWRNSCGTVYRLPLAKPADASSAADVRGAFYEHCHGQVAKKEVGLRMARKGFAEDTRNYWVGVKKTSKRVYCLAVDGNVQVMALKGTGSGTGGAQYQSFLHLGSVFLV